MTIELVPTEAQAFADWKKLVANTIAKGQNLSEIELNLFGTVARHLNLDVWRREVYAIRYKGQVQFVVGLDGYLRRAQETGEYDGHETIQFAGPDGVWTELWVSDKPPTAAKATVYRKGMRVGVTYVARWKTFARYFNGKLGETWEQMPDLMLGKCALVHALREAFPDAIGTMTEHITTLRSEGIVVNEETGEITEQDKEPAVATVRPSEPSQPRSEDSGNASTRFWNLALHLSKGQVPPMSKERYGETFLRREFGITDFALLTPEQQEQAVSRLEASP